MKKTKLITLSLPCPLTDEQWRDASKELAGAIRRIQETKEERKLACEGFAEDIKNFQAKANYLHRLVEKSEEDCEVNCSQEFDFKKGIVVTRRGDTGEIVERREITPDERQDDLFED